MSNNDESGDEVTSELNNTSFSREDNLYFQKMCHAFVDSIVYRKLHGIKHEGEEPHFKMMPELCLTDCEAIHL